MKRSPNTGFDILPFAAVLFLVLAWQAADIAFSVPDYVMPSPFEIGAELVRSWPVLQGHLGVTLLETLAGLSAALVLGTASAVLMSGSRTARRLLRPLFVISQTVPLTVLAPLLMVWFGFGIGPKIGLVTLVCFFPIAVSFEEGLSGADPDMEALLLVMGATKVQVFLKARLPHALPSLFSGLRIAATYSVMGAVLAEWVGGKSGLGIFMTRAMASYRRSALLADTVLVIALSLVLVWMVSICEKCVIRYRKVGMR